MRGPGTGDRGRNGLGWTGTALVLVVCSVPCPLSPVPALLAQQRQQAASRACVIRVDSTKGDTQFFRQPDGSQNVFSGGGVWAHCVDQPTTIQSDSMAYFQATGLLQFVGSVHFRDSTSLLDADKITYWVRQERLYAEGNVYSRNTASGSEMRGPNLDYYRAVPPIRDTLELFATGRPTIRFVPAGDSARGNASNPFIIIADRTKLRHTDRMWGSGHVVIDRPDLHATADSALLDLADSLGWLIGAPIIVGRDTTRRADSTNAHSMDSLITYRLTGQRVRFDLGEHQSIRRVHSYRDADALGPDWHLTADTLDMQLDSGKIQRAQAWGDERRPVAVSGLSRIVADSLDIQMPGQVMTLVWAYRGARATTKPDSTAPEDDWLSGDSLRADFAQQVDSAGKHSSEIERVTAFGSARAYYHTDNDKDPHGEKGINYSRGDRIRIAMRERKVRTVDIVGEVDGIYLEPLPAGWETLQTDTAKARRGEQPSAPPASSVTPGSTPPAAPGAPVTPPAPQPAPAPTGLPIRPRPARSR